VTATSAEYVQCAITFRPESRSKRDAARPLACEGRVSGTPLLAVRRQAVRTDPCSQEEIQLEGIIAKRKGSAYEPGRRSAAWVKYKINRSQEFVIGGYTPGNPFDALIVGYYDGADLKFAAKVRNGFVPHVRREVFHRFIGLTTTKCPFVNLPEKRRTM